MQNFSAKFRAALFISHMDKEARKVDKYGPEEKNMTQTIVEHNGKKSTEYVPEVPADIKEEQF